MNLLTVEDIEKHYGDRTLFKGLTAGIMQGERIALVGRNGCGKSTLLDILAGRLAPDAGRVVRNGACRIEHVPQNPDVQSGLSLLEQIMFDGSEELDLVRDHWMLVDAVGDEPGDAGLQRRLHDSTERMDRLGLWNVDQEVRSIMTRLGLTDPSRKVQTLSGGERRRMALARALIRPADLLLLDEPTNHLDLATILWLEQRLVARSGALVLVTHDRAFLDRVCGRIWELDPPSLHVHPAPFENYLARRAERRREERDAQRARRSQLRREQAWMRAGVQGRGTRQAARVARFEELTRQKPVQREPSFAFDVPMHRLGKQSIELCDVSFSWTDEPLLCAINHTFQAGERLAIVGTNGAGKSTLLSLIAGRLAPDAGEVNTGKTVHIGFLDQHSTNLDDERSVLDTVLRTRSWARDGQGRIVDAERWLERFGFMRSRHAVRTGDLSGGERRRLALLDVLLDGPNVLLLDEPTNDLDLETLLVLEDFLEGFAGIVVFVSHDRRFVDNNADWLLAIGENGRASHMTGSYEAWLDEEKESQDKAQNPPRRDAQDDGTVRLSYHDKKRLEELERTIPEQEAKRADIEGQMLSSADDCAALQALQRDLDRLDADLQAAYETWTQLAQKAEDTR